MSSVAWADLDISSEEEGVEAGPGAPALGDDSYFAPGASHPVPPPQDDVGPPCMH